MATIITTKTSLTSFCNKNFYVNNIESYSLDKKLYLFKEGLKKNSALIKLKIKRVTYKN